jgi:hypothetical protein
MSRLLLTSIGGLAALALGSSAPAYAHGPIYGHAAVVTRGYSYHAPVYTGGTAFVASTPHAYVSTGSSFVGLTPHAYLTSYGTKFSHGYYFGPTNFYWTKRSWSSIYNCWTYWNPYASSWYYWSGPQGFYYPVSYITVAPPVVTTGPVVAVLTP